MVSRNDNNLGVRLFSVLVIWLLICIGFIGLNIVTDEVRAGGPTYISGIISTNTTWIESENPYIVTNNLLVENGVTLTIKPGVEVKFNEGYYLMIEGSLIAIGNEDNHIIFTSNKDRPYPGVWKYIEFADKSNDSECVIEYSEIKYAERGIYCDYASPKIINNFIFNNEDGINCQYSNTHKIDDNTISYNSRGIVLAKSDPIISNNSITNNGQGISCHEKSSPLIKNNLILRNDDGIRFEFGGTAEVYNNTLIKNKNGIHVKGKPETDSKITNNNICENFNYNIKNEYNANDINASNNYWGTINTTEIDDRIYDYNDDYNWGKVIYIPFLIKPNPNAPEFEKNKLPVANAGLDQNATTGQIVYFDGSGSYDPDEDILNYKWDFGDGTSTDWQIDCNSSHYYTIGGIYNGTLTVSDGFLTDKDFCIVKINRPPVADAGSDQSAKIGQTIYFDGSGSYDPDGDPLTYNWSFGDGSSTGWQNQNTTSHSYTTPGNYTVTLTVSDGELTDTDTCFVQVSAPKVNQPPVANAGQNLYVIINQTVNFDGSGSSDPDGDNITYNWDFGDGTSTGWKNSSNTSYKYTKPGNYTIRLTVSDGSLNDTDHCYVKVTRNESSYYNKNWSIPKKIIDFDYSFIPSPSSISVDSNGDWHIVFPDRDRYKNQSETRYVKYMNKTTTMTLAKEFGTQFNRTGKGVGHPSIAIDSKGDLHVVYIQWSNNDWDNQSIMYTTKKANSNTWSTAQELTKFEYSFIPSPVSIAVDSNGDWHIVFPDRDRYKNQSETRYVKYMNKTTTMTLAKEFGTQFSRTGKGVGHPSIAIDSKGDLHVVYIQWSNNDWDNQSIMYTIKKPNSNTWSTAQELTKFEYSFIPSPVSIVVDSNGDWHIVFPDRDTYKDQSETRYVKYMNKTATVTLAKEFGTQFSRTGKGVGHPSIAIDSKGDLHVVYIQWSNNDWDNQSIMYITNKTQTIPINKLDTDQDNMPDAWEIVNGLDPQDPLDAFHDLDGDALSNLDEYYYNTNPNHKDTDGDGIIDSEDAYPLDPTKWEGDGIDTDGDGLPDTWESFYGLNPNNPMDALLDGDGDNLTNIEEYKLGTNPTKTDTDGDGYLDNVDAFPNDPINILKEPPDKKPGFDMFLILIGIIVIILIFVLLIGALFILKNKHRIETRSTPDDETYGKALAEIISNKRDTELTAEEFRNLLESKFQDRGMSPDTYNYMNNFIEKNNNRKY